MLGLTSANRPIGWVCFVLVFAACSATPGKERDTSGTDSGAPATGGGGGGPSASAGTSSGATPGTDVEIDSLDAGASDSGNKDCNPNLTGVVRDFDSTHADFQNDVLAMGTNPFNITVGLVQDSLVDGAPVLVVPTPTAVDGDVTIASAASFAEWYSVDHPADKTVEFNIDENPEILTRTEQADGTVVYESGSFFPIDDLEGSEETEDHNYHFTFELNTTFQYHAGDVFDFSGDDDLWVFIDGKLAVDVGGVHIPLNGSIELDTLGLTEGEEYSLSVFNAERQTSGSNFKITTSLTFTNCDPIIRIR
jgi:fibro-slime domain-containing protein